MKKAWIIEKEAHTDTTYLRNRKAKIYFDSMERTLGHEYCYYYDLYFKDNLSGILSLEENEIVTAGEFGEGSFELKKWIKNRWRQEQEQVEEKEWEIEEGTFSDTTCLQSSDGTILYFDSIDRDAEYYKLYLENRLSVLLPREENVIMDADVDILAEDYPERIKWIE